MAGYSDNREKNYEQKYLRKVLGEVDARIQTPDSIRGKNLIHKLDDINPNFTVNQNKKFRASSTLRWFNLHSALTYVAAFTLVVGVFYGMGFDKQQKLVIEDLNNSTANNASNFSAFSQEEPSQDAINEEPQEPQNNLAQRATFAQEEVIQNSESISSTEPETAIGGAGISTQIGEQAGFIYAWRNNDASDPDKGSFPITIDVVSKSQANLAAQIDIVDMQNIIQTYFTDTTALFVGTNSDGIVTKLYEIINPESPKEISTFSQQGEFIASRQYKDFVHTISFSDVKTLNESEKLPYSIDSSECIFTAINTITGENSVKSFAGSTRDINLYDLGAYISYNGEPEDLSDLPIPELPIEDSGKTTSLYIAQIHLDGLNVSFVGVS